MSGHRQHIVRLGILTLVVVMIAAPPSQAQEWESTHGPPGGEVLVALELGDGTIFAGTAVKGIFYRRVDESGWNRVVSPVFDGIQVRAIIEYDGMLVVGTGGNGIYSSKDGGQSWLPFNVGLVSPTIFDLLVSGDNRLYVGTSSGLYRYGNGNEWVLIENLVRGLSIRTIVENDEGHLFVGAFGSGVYRSLNLGLSWQLMDNGVATTVIRSLAVGPSNELYLGTFGGQVVQRSDDNGDTWKAAGSGLEAKGVWSVVVGKDGTLYAGTRTRGISYSNDAGMSWRQSDSPPTTVSGFTFSEDGSVWAATRVGIMRSTDKGESWSVEGIPYSRINALLVTPSSNLDASGSGRLLAGTDLGGIFYSDDGGGTWSRTNVNAEKILSIQHGRDGLLYGTSLQGRVYVSADSGRMWELIWKTVRVPYSVTADSRGSVFAGTETGIFSREEAGNWVRVALPGVRVWALDVDTDRHGDCELRRIGRKIARFA